jgi:hypothetical protein
MLLDRAQLPFQLALVVIRRAFQTDTKESSEGFALDCFLPRRGPSTVRQPLGRHDQQVSRWGARWGTCRPQKRPWPSFRRAKAIRFSARRRRARLRDQIFATAQASCGKAQATDTFCRSPATVHVFGRRLRRCDGGVVGGTLGYEQIISVSVWLIEYFRWTAVAGRLQPRPRFSQARARIADCAGLPRFFSTKIRTAAANDRR